MQINNQIHWYIIKIGPLKNFRLKSQIGYGKIVGFLIYIEEN